MKVHTSIVEQANRPKKIKGNGNKAEREAAIAEKQFAKGKYACLKTDPTPRKIMAITESAHLELEGIAGFVTPCTALPAKKPKK
ncbi:MAG TPA: hypothetical protein VGN56_01485 [Candidatus Paceibacterota bacterium]|jgi:hypothetical protein|nr:hypothetical protein [Candidatus Paceibacterota bacterium]